MANNGGALSGPAIGIDLGTTNSCVAIWENNNVTIIADDQGNRTTPSYVSFGERERFIGEIAKNQGARFIANTIYDAKRLMGKRFTDETVQNDTKLWPFKIINSSEKDNKPMYEVTYKGQQKQIATEEISSMVLLKMKEIAEAYLGTKVLNVVVTVPGHFNNSQRQATKDAATIAGLNVMSIINEPTATAIAYGLGKMGTTIKDKAKNVLIFDLGGGTFDVSLVRIEKERLEVKGVKGDTHLGGSDFDNRMVEHFVAEFKKKHKKDISKNYKALRKLRIACEEAKRILSSNKQAPIDIDCLFEEIDFHSTITLEKFEELNFDLFIKCLECLQKCLRQAKIEKYQVDDVVLVGGSTRIQKVQKMLKDFFNGKELCKSVNADEVVAYGAAIRAAILSGAYTKKGYEFLDVIPFSIGYKKSSNSMEIVIPKITKISTKKLLVLETHGDDDKMEILNVFEGEKADTRENHFLGTFNLPPKKKGYFIVKNKRQAPSRGDTKYNVWFEIDSNGILIVSAQHVNTTTILNHNDRLSKDEIDRMLANIKKFNNEDNQYKKYMEDLLALKTDFDNMWKRLSYCKKMFEEGDSNMEDAIEDITQYLNENSVFDQVSKFEKNLKEIQSIRNLLMSRRSL